MAAASQALADSNLKSAGVNPERIGVEYGANLIDARARRLDLEETLNQTFDRYAFIRNAYLQQREYQVTDGNVPPPSLEDDEPLEDPAPEEDKK